MSQSTTTLYRQYRPQTFAEVIGQDHIIKVLQAAIEQNKISQAYLFAGSRGTGKTSVARILAKSLQTSDRDLIEIDGASNRGIGEIKELQEAVTALPFESPQKVYIIDEVHMLTKEAFNALLKTLEEPPEHVIFILATTELAKVPDTIVSRCQTHTFHKPSVAALEQVINQVAKKEKITLAAGVARLLAILGDGSFRDALGLLQKVIILSADKQIDLSEAETIIGAPSRQLIQNFITHLLAGEINQVLTLTEKLTATNTDFAVFLKLLLRELRLATIAALAPDYYQTLTADLTADDRSWLETTAKQPQARFLPAVIKEFIQTAEWSDQVHLPQLPIELAAIKVIEQLISKPS